MAKISSPNTPHRRNKITREEKLSECIAHIKPAPKLMRILLLSRVKIGEA